MLKVSLDKAKKEKLFYFVVTGVIYRPKDGRCLILKRSKNEVAHPSLWGVIGGKLEWQDLKEEKMTKMNYDIPNWDGTVEDLLFREAYEESRLNVSDPRYLSSVTFIRPDGVPVVCAKFGAKYKSGKVKIAQEFEDFAWVNEKEVKRYNIIGGIDKDIALAIAAYN